MCRLVSGLVLAVIATASLGCGGSHATPTATAVDSPPTRLVEAKARATDSVHEPVPMLMRMACSELEEVDYDYWSLDAQLPMGMLQAAWHQYDRPPFSTTEADCDLRWKRPADDVLALHFSDYVRSSILNTCKVWFATIDAVGPVSWKDYADTLRPQRRLSLAPEHRAELRRLDVNAISATVIYNEFDKDETEILSFCKEAVQLGG